MWDIWYMQDIWWPKGVRTHRMRTIALHVTLQDRVLMQSEPYVTCLPSVPRDSPIYGWYYRVLKHACYILFPLVLESNSSPHACTLLTWLFSPIRENQTKALSAYLSCPYVKIFEKSSLNKCWFRLIILRYNPPWQRRRWQEKVSLLPHSGGRERWTLSSDPFLFCIGSRTWA